MATDLFSGPLKPPRPAPQKPDFRALLANPTSDEPLPKGFDPAEEASYLDDIWSRTEALRGFTITDFVRAGGNGMVFRALHDTAPSALALKLARKRLYLQTTQASEVAAALSPVSEAEMRAMKQLSHPHLVRLHAAIEESGRVIALATTYIDKPRSLVSYLRTWLNAPSDGSGPHGAERYAPTRVEQACEFLIARATEVASALAHMHSLYFYHFDVKPDNILVSANGKAYLTDMGSCVHAPSPEVQAQVRVHFTWTYAHPSLTTLIKDPSSISGGGLHASANAEPPYAKYDLFALGKSLQECLAVLDSEFGGRCDASYAVRYLHLVACLLLDGKNAPGSGERRRIATSQRDGRHFVDDTALGYPYKLFELKKFTSAEETRQRLELYSVNATWMQQVPELSSWHADTINTGQSGQVSYSKRVKALLEHPVLVRLRGELHLGWVKEVFPNATHTRWAHTLGTYAMTLSYYEALLADPEIPTFRILAKSSDIEHALVAAILHDAGQTAFGHDFESVCDSMFSHEGFVKNLLTEERWGHPTIEELLKREWPAVDTNRVLSILQREWFSRNPEINPNDMRFVDVMDGVASDILNGPIDADKLDYLRRDGAACGVPYARGVDVRRVLRALSVDVELESAKRCHLRLAYKAKGRAAVESLLLARYQMYGGVYWHHTFRCMQGMFFHATALALREAVDGRTPIMLFGQKVFPARLVKLYYNFVILKRSWEECDTGLWMTKEGKDALAEKAPAWVEAVPAFEFVWKIGAPIAPERTDEPKQPSARVLIERLAERKLYRRLCEIRLGVLGQSGDYSQLKNEMGALRRLELAKDIQKRLVLAIKNGMRDRGPTETITATQAQSRLESLESSAESLVVIDFPTRGVATEPNLPREIGDAERKYFSIAANDHKRDDNIFFAVRRLQTLGATLRVFGDADLHGLVTHYGGLEAVRDCVKAAIPQLAELK